jgi:hypothetical protein
MLDHAFNTSAEAVNSTPARSFFGHCSVAPCPWQAHAGPHVITRGVRVLAGTLSQRIARGESMAPALKYTAESHRDSKQQSLKKLAVIFVSFSVLSRCMSVLQDRIDQRAFRVALVYTRPRHTCAGCGGPVAAQHGRPNLGLGAVAHDLTSETGEGFLCRGDMNHHQRTLMAGDERIEQRGRFDSAPSPFGAKLTSLPLRSPMNFRLTPIPGRNDWGIRVIWLLKLLSRLASESSISN